VLNFIVKVNLLPFTFFIIHVLKTLNMKKISLMIIIITCIAGVRSYGQMTDTIHCPYDCCRPDGHAPLGIMTDHVHGRNQWTVSYSYMNMMMKGNRIGTRKADDSEILKDYAMAPSEMTMQMQMVMVMYGITNKITVMGMVNYVSNTMSMNMTMDAMTTMQNMPGMDATSIALMNESMQSKSSGIGDASVYGLYKLMDANGQRFIVSAGVGIPTGSIKESGTTMLGVNTRLSYLMQLGTGTFNFLPGITYVGQGCRFSYGGVINGNIKTNTNSEGYSWGNEYDISSWIAYKFHHLLSTSFRLEGVSTDKISGYDANIYPLYKNDPNANTENFGGQRVNAYLGLNFYKDKCSFKGLRFLVEYGIPVYQNLNGAQMSLQGTLIAGCQYTF
jgi:hypothetical protein